MPLSEHQWEISSDDASVVLVFGTADTGIQTSRAPDLGQRAVRTTDAPLPREDGVGMGIDYEGGTTVTFEANVLTTGWAEQSALLDALRGVWGHKAFRDAPHRVGVLRTLGPNLRRCYGRPRRFAEADGDLTHHGYTPVVFDFATVDGKFYEDAEKVASIPFTPPTTGGLTDPLTDPLTSTGPSVSPGQITVDTETWATVTFHGPITNPVLDFGDFEVGLDYTIPDGMSVTVDPRPWSRGVRRSDGAGMAGALTYDTPPMRDLKAPAGTYLVTLRGTDATGTSAAEIRWREAHNRP